MSDVDVLEVSARESLGKLNSRRLRAEGIVPAVLYGHGEASVSLKLTADQLRASLRHGAHIVELKGDAKGQALLQDIQWDTFQQHILHVDLLRVDAKERVKVVVPVVLRGSAPGENEGGVIEFLQHSIEIETTVASVPESLHLSVNDLHLEGSLKAADLDDMPEGALVVGNADAVIVQCVTPTAASDEEDAVAAGGAEPEVIGQKDDEQEGDSK
ncbi:MAG: 50S ribosomal protein L25 [Planctomycetes bacterium]|nr:50S ribosomal protein L25 [Planctomycetota bacterium]